MNDRPKPIHPAVLLRRARGRLSRYRQMPDALTAVNGRLDDVRTVNDGAWIVVRPVDGLEDHEMATATVHDPAPEVDTLLEKIGHGGRITLIGMANTGTGTLPDIRMSEVLSINGTPTAMPRANPPRAWWQFWRKNTPEQHAQT